jgi:hypothetical protein
MPPIPEDDQESARLTGKRRYEIFVDEVGRRIAEGHRLTAEVLQTIPVDQPDLFAAAPRDTLIKRPLAASNSRSTLNGHASEPDEASGHG